MTADGIATRGSLLSGIYQAVRGWLIPGSGTTIFPETVEILATTRLVTLEATTRSVILEVQN